MEERRELTFKVQCFNPEVDDKPSWRSYNVELEKGITILRAINHIKDKLDPSLTMRFFCQAGICGSCAVKVNGVSKLACTTQVWDEIATCNVEGVIEVAPLKNFKILRDLVVDIDPMIQKLRNHKAWTVPDLPAEELGIKEHAVSPEEFEVINPATDCILCASCYSECSLSEVSAQYISPLVMLKVYRMQADKRDTLNEERLQIAVQDGGIWDCTHCYRCVEACVKNIPIMDAIQGLRHESLRRKMDFTEGARHALAFEEDIESTGRLVEITLLPRTLGPLGALKQIPFALGMAKAGRVPPLFPHKSKDHGNLKRMIKQLRKDQADNANQGS